MRRAQRFQLPGQKCSACSRVIVLEHCRRLLEPACRATRSPKLAPAEDPDCSTGPP